MLLFCMATMAQSSMTDDQIIKFVIKEQKAGTSQQEIAVKLIQRGVTPEQIKRVQKKAERLKKEQGLGTVAGKTLGTDENLGRQRKNNGQDKTLQKVKDVKKSRRLLTAEEAKEETDEDTRLIKDDLDEFMPDSFDIYDREVIRKYLKAKDEYEKKDKK